MTQREANYIKEIRRAERTATDQPRVRTQRAERTAEQSHARAEHAERQAPGRLRSQGEHTGPLQAPQRVEHTGPVKTDVPRDSWFKRNSVFIIVALATVAVVAALSFVIRDVGDSRAYDRYMTSSRECILTGDYDNALSMLRKAAGIDATDDCLLLMAQCYEAQGKYDKAILALRSMKSASAAVTTKIAAIEAAQIQAENERIVQIGEETYDINSTSLALDNKGLGNEIMESIMRMYALSSLSLSGNNITDISGLTALQGLTSLNLNDNRITDISVLMELPSLRTLYLDNNPIIDLSPLSSMQSLTSLSIKGIEISADQLKAFSEALPNCAINGADAQETEQYIALGGITFGKDVKELDLSYKGITDISVLSQCSNLLTLNLCGNAVADITPLMDIPNLTTLNISGNGIIDLRPLMGLASLKSLDCSSNNISTTVPLGTVTGLTDLNISNNPVSNFSGLAKLKNLVTLDISNTNFSPADVLYFQLLSRLQSLNIENNPAMTGEALSQLQSLVPICSIRHSDVIYSISVPANGLTVEKTATDLDFTGQGIEDISFIQQLGQLQSLRLAANRISNVGYFLYTESWRTLTYLDLSYNNITDISPLKALSNLVTLNISNNNITNITALYSMSNLRELNISGNPLTDDQVRELNSWLPNCSIIFW